MEIFITYKDFIINLILLCLTATAIGYERQKSAKVIGIRTVMLIMLGSFVYSIISLHFSEDSSKVIGQIVTGVGFIGGGIIFKNGGEDIKNVTTAVLVWTCSAIACLIALNFRVEAIVITIIVLCILQSQNIFKDKQKI